MNWSGTATVQAFWQSLQPVHAAQSTKRALFVTVAVKSGSFTLDVQDLASVIV